MENKHYLIIAAGGQSKRFGKDKLFEKILNKTVLEWSLYNLKKIIKFEKIAIVLNKKNIEKTKKILKDYILVEGGEKRAISVYNGFLELKPENNSFVIIHDAARPLVPIHLIKNLTKEIKNEKGVIPVLPVKETLKKIKNDYIEETIDRKEIFSVQTPQIFKADVLYKAYELKRKIWEDLTDESQLLELLKIPVKVIPGSPLNIKITYKEDLEILKFILKKT